MADKAYNVEIFKGTITIPASDTVSTGTVSFPDTSGVTKVMVWSTANMEDTDSTAFAIVTPFGKTIYSSGTLAESTNTISTTEVPVRFGDKIVATAEGTQSASRALTFEVRYVV